MFDDLSHVGKNVTRLGCVGNTLVENMNVINFQMFMFLLINISLVILIERSYILS